MTIDDQTVDITGFQPRVLNGVGTGLEVKTQRRPVRDPPLGGIPHTDNGILVFQIHWSYLTSFVTDDD